MHRIYSKKPMAPTRLGAYLETLGLPQHEAGPLIGIDERTLRRYLSGESLIPRVVELAVLAAVAGLGR